MDKVIIKKAIYDFIGTCVDNPFKSNNKLNNVIDNAENVSKDDFLNHVEIDDELLQSIKEYPNDFRFYYNKKDDVYFFIHSAIEYFYKEADNINLLQPDLPNSDVFPDRDKTDLKNHFKKRKKPFRNESYGRDEVLMDGSGGYRNQDNVMGTDNSWNGNL